MVLNPLQALSVTMFMSMVAASPLKPQANVTSEIHSVFPTPITITPLPLPTTTATTHSSMRPPGGGSRECLLHNMSGSKLVTVTTYCPL